MGRVLVVDDNRETADAVRRLLRHAGHQAIAIDDGAKALQWLAREQEQPDLVLLDWMMPRVGGADVLKAIRSDPLYAELRVVVFSAAYEYDTVDEATRLGADDYIAKGSIRWDEMVRKLEQHMRGRGARAARGASSEKGERGGSDAPGELPSHNQNPPGGPMN